MYIQHPDKKRKHVSLKWRTPQIWGSPRTLDTLLSPFLTQTKTYYKIKRNTPPKHILHTHASMYLKINIQIYIYIYINTHIYIYLHTTHMYLFMHINTYTYITIIYIYINQIVYIPNPNGPQHSSHSEFPRRFRKATGLHRLYRWSLVIFRPRCAKDVTLETNVQTLKMVKTHKRTCHGDGVTILVETCSASFFFHFPKKNYDVLAKYGNLPNVSGNLLEFWSQKC